MVLVKCKVVGKLRAVWILGNWHHQLN